MANSIQDPILAAGVREATHRAARMDVPMEVDIRGNFHLPSVLSRLACTILDELVEKALQCAEPKQLSLTALGVNRITVLDISVPVPEAFSLASMEAEKDFFQTANGTVAVETTVIPKEAKTKCGNNRLDIQLFIYDYESEVKKAL